MASTAARGPHAIPLGNGGLRRHGRDREAPTDRLVAVDDRVAGFARLVGRSGLRALLDPDGAPDVTVFAPTTTAIESSTWPANRGHPTRIVAAHVVRGRIGAEELSADLRVRTVGGGTLTLHRTTDGLEVLDGDGDPATALTANLEVAGMTIHVIDRVLASTARGRTTLRRARPRPTLAPLSRPLPMPSPHSLPR